MAGIFTISLDFELHWGGFEKWPISVAGHQSTVTNPPDKRQRRHGKWQMATYDQYFLNTRQVIPGMLELFEQYDVHVTWAAVGMLMNKSKDELLKNSPHQKPTYTNKELSAYHYIASQGIGEDEKSDPFHFAPSLIKKIQQTRNQELGSHSFAHFYCNEPGQTLAQFRDDLKAAQNSAALLGTSLRSLVFPRNQFNDEYLKVCFEEGFTSVRSNPVDWFWNIESTQNESTWKRLNRGLDAYFPIGKKNTYRMESIIRSEGYPVQLPASRLLRPYNPKELFLNHLKLHRIGCEMQEAARDGEIYHLWWHPHNFGHYPNESLHALETILLSFKKMNEKYGMKSLNMGEISTLIKNSI